MGGLRFLNASSCSSITAFVFVKVGQANSDDMSMRYIFWRIEIGCWTSDWARVCERALWHINIYRTGSDKQSKQNQNWSFEFVFFILGRLFVKPFQISKLLSKIYLIHEILWNHWHRILLIPASIINNHVAPILSIPFPYLV